VISGTASHAVAWRVASGTEGGATISVPLSGASATRHVAYRIAGQTLPPQSATATGSSATPNPPALTPTWGSAETLWIATMAHDGSTLATAPANYANAVVEVGDPAVGAAWRVSVAATENPAAWTASRSDDWIAGVVAVRSK
jgi:hypothetical protein